MGFDFLRLFSPHADALARVLICFLLAGPILVWGLAHALSGSPYATGQGRVLHQPVPFSHEHHVGEMGLDCRFCHATVETSRYAGAPALHVCMTCHSQLFTEARVLAPVRRAAASADAIEWARVHRLPDYVYFDHSVHVANGVGCAECHGNMSEMPLTRQQAPLTMQWCLDCHRNPGPHLRDQASITDPRSVDTDQALIVEYLRAYEVHPEHLTECSTCHR